jgi:hypothetical protein
MALGFGIAVWYQPPLNDLNTKFQGQQKFISDLFGSVRAFEVKLELLQKQLKMLTCPIFFPVICFVRMAH